MGANFIDEMRDNYLAHFGKKGQTWYVRNYQSYETVPTRSGKVGEFRGESEKEYRKERSDYANQNAFERTAEAFKSGAITKDRKFRKQLTKHYAAIYDAEHGRNEEKNRERAKKALEKSTKYVVNKDAVNNLASGKVNMRASDYEDYYARATENEIRRGAAKGVIIGGILGGVIGGVVANNRTKQKLSSARASNSKRMQEELAAMRSITTSFDEVKKEYTTRVDLAKYSKESSDPSIKGYTNQYKEIKALEAKRKAANASSTSGYTRYDSSNEASSTSGYTRKENKEELKRRMKSASTGRKIARAIVPGLNYYDIAKTGSQMKKEGRFKK